MHSGHWIYTHCSAARNSTTWSQTSYYVQSQRTIHLHGLFTGCHQSAFSPVLSFLNYETTTVAVTNGVFQTSHQHNKWPEHFGLAIMPHATTSWAATPRQNERNPACRATKQSKPCPTYMPTEHNIQRRGLHRQNVCVYFPLYEFQ